MSTRSSRGTRCGSAFTHSGRPCRNAAESCPHKLNGTHARIARESGAMMLPFPEVAGPLLAEVAVTEALEHDEHHAQQGPAARWQRCRGYLVKRNKVTTDRCDHLTEAADGLCGYERCASGPAAALFDTDTMTAPAPAAAGMAAGAQGRFWLTDLRAGVFDVITGHDAFRDAMARASASAAGASVKKLEAAVAAELSDPELVQVLLAAIDDHAADHPFRTLPPVTGMRWRYLETASAQRAEQTGERDRAGADLIADLTFADGTTVEVPTNVKWHQVGGAINGADALNRRTLLWGLRGGKLEDRSHIGESPSRDLLDLYAGDFELRPWDYYLLIVTSDKATGQLYNVRFQGILSTELDEHTLALTPHTTRPDSIGFVASTKPLSDDHDLAASLLKATNRTPDAHQLGLSALTFWERHTTAAGQEAAHLAQRARLVRDADPAMLTEALGAFFARLEALTPAVEDTPAPVPVQLDLFGQPAA